MSNLNAKSAKKRKSIVKAEDVDSSPKKIKVQNGKPKNANNKNNQNKKKESSPKEKKVKMFAGTTEIDANAGKNKKAKKNKEANKQNQQPAISAKVKKVEDGKKLKTKGSPSLFHLQSRLKTESKEVVLKSLEEKIKGIEGRKTISKTGKRKLKLWKKCKLIIEQGGDLKTMEPKETDSKKRRVRKEKAAEKKNAAKRDKKSDKDGENGVEESEDENEGSDSNEEEEEEEAENDDVEEESSEEENQVEKIKAKPVNQADGSPKNNNQKGEKSRFVVFVGNLPFDAGVDELQKHFTKCGEIADVRIQTDKATGKARGFGFVELKNKESYEKAISLHHTMFKGRRINVNYTQPKQGKNNDKVVKAKNFKLHAMKKEGLLAGSKKGNQKRAERRNKKVAN